jgi:putative endonuclease
VNPTSSKDAPAFSVYIVECADATFYTGYTNNLTRRIREHNTARAGARYTRGRRPVKLVYVETAASLPDALRRETRIKRLTRAQKLLLVQESSEEGFQQTQSSSSEASLSSLKMVADGERSGKLDENPPEETADHAYGHGYLYNAAPDETNDGAPPRTQGFGA